jgi:hypothetical protein
MRGVRDDLLDAATAACLARARAGEDVARHLKVAALVPGDVGVLEVQVRAVAPVRTYVRKRGGEGLLQRVTLADATGEVDLVLWDDETRQAKDGPLQPGAFLRLRGAAVKAGHRGGVELGLGSALVEGLGVAFGAATTLEGVLVSFGEVRPVGDPPAVRFTMEAVLDTVSGKATLVAWDAAVKSLRIARPGDRVIVQGALTNPLLDGWWTAGAEARIAVFGREPQPRNG